MERLPNETLKNAIGVYKTTVEACKNIDGEYYNPTLDKVTIKFLEELQQYRATGLTPTMIEDLKKGINKAHKAALENAHLLDEYKVLEEQGLLLRLPVAEGAKVFIIVESYIWGELGDDVEPWYTILETKFDRSDIEDFGKTIFLTREEAEAALEKMKGEEHETN